MGFIDSIYIWEVGWASLSASSSSGMAAAASWRRSQTANGAPQPLNEVQGEQGQDEMDKSFDEILRIFNKDKF